LTFLMEDEVALKNVWISSLHMAILALRVRE